MFKNYFSSLGNLFKETALFAKDNFVKYMLIIWLLILAQMIFGIPVFYISKEFGFINLSLALKISYLLMFGAFFYVFFLMFKKVFELAALGLKKDEISNLKIIKSAIVLTLFNLIPIAVLFICFYLSSWIPSLEKFIKYIPNIFAAIFYFVMSLSVASIVKWQNKNVFLAVLKSLKVFFKKIIYSLPLFLVIFICAGIITWLFCTILFAIFMYFNVLTYSLIDAIHTIINTCSLYIISGFYIGAQVKLLEGENE